MLCLKLFPLFIIIQFFSITLGKNIKAALLPSRSVCGKQEVERIFHGKTFKFFEFPWMVLIESRTGPYGKFICGGVLINSRYVLTAAHCIHKTVVSVRLGEHDINTSEDCADVDTAFDYCADPPLDIEVEEKIVHNRYNVTDNAYADIALIRLTEEVVYTDYIRPICLPTFDQLQNDTFSNTQVVVAGWGKTENRWASNVKLKVEGPVVSLKECARTWKRHNISLTNSKICAGKRVGRSLCIGDSGGPLMYLHNTSENQNWVSIGVESFGLRECGFENLPPIYTKVSEFIPWILDNIRV